MAMLPSSIVAGLEAVALVPWKLKGKRLRSTGEIARGAPYRLIPQSEISVWLAKLGYLEICESPSTMGFGDRVLNPCGRPLARRRPRRIAPIPNLTEKNTGVSATHWLRLQESRREERIVPVFLLTTELLQLLDSELLSNDRLISTCEYRSIYP